MNVSSLILSNVARNTGKKYIFILIGAIVLAGVISCTAQGQDFHKAKKRHFKARYRTQIKTAGNECAILIKRRTAPQNKKASLFAASTRKPKYKPQAEVDGGRFGMVNQ